MEERKKKRSHEEVLAAREQYQKEVQARKEARAAKKAARTSARTEEERRKGLLSKGNFEPKRQYETYKGDVAVGDTVQIVFAGSILQGKLVRIAKAINTDGELRGGRENITLYTILSSDGYKYPVSREKVIAKIE